MTTVGDRRHISVLFFDVVEATPLSERLDPEDLRDILQALHAACETAVREHGGHVAQRLGDGLLAYFGYPQAFEDSPRRAIRAGLATLRTVRAAARELRPRVGSLIKTRLGIHTGPVVLDDVGTPERPEILAIGETPNKAARVQSAAMADSLVVSEATYRLTRGYFKFVELGSEQLRGFSQPVRLHAVIEETDVRSRLDVFGAAELTGFVNREEPLRSLRDRWEEARQGGSPIVAISGDAGIGKSRLVRALREGIDPDGAFFVTWYCSAYFQATAWWPIVDMLQRWLSIEGDEPAQRLDRLRNELSNLGVASPAVLARLASLLSLSVPEEAAPATVTTAQKERQETFEALFTWLMRLTTVRPVLLVVEDLHWIDPSTLEFLSMVAQRSPAGPLMTIVTHRPEFAVPWSGPRLTALTLGRLSREHSEEVLSSVAGGDALSDETVEALLARADGVPLFLEEITKAFLESRQPTDALRPARKAASVPETLQDSLFARLDRLGSGKIVAQLAATIGRTFDFGLLSAVAGLPDAELRAELDRLVTADILHRKGLPPNETFIFKHALIQDAAYASLLRRVRSQYHLRIVEALKSQLAASGNARPELLAFHCAGAGRSQEAITHWLAAAQRAMARSAFSEAIDILTRALGELMNLPTSSERDRIEIDLRSALGLALISTRGWAVPEVEENYGRLLQLCESFGDVPVQVLYGLWGVQLVRADLEGATRLAGMFRSLLAGSDDPRTRIAAESALGAFAFYRGDHPEAIRRFREALAIMRASPGMLEELKAGKQDYGLDAYINSELYVPFCLQGMGALAEAKRVWREACAWLEETRHPFLIATALGYGVVVAQAAGDREETATLADRLSAVCAENGFHYWQAAALCASGWARASLTAGEQGITQIEQGLATFRFLGALLVYPYFAALLAEAQLVAGDLEGAAATVEDGLGVIRDRLCSGHAPRLLFLRGEIGQRRGDLEAAVRDFEASIEQSDAGGNLLVAIDSAHHLARLVAGRGDASVAVRRLDSLVRRAPDGMTHPRFAAARRWLAEHS